jgi:hypothetical protein
LCTILVLYNRLPKDHHDWCQRRELSGGRLFLVCDSEENFQHFVSNDKLSEFQKAVDRIKIEAFDVGERCKTFLVKFWKYAATATTHLSHQCSSNRFFDTERFCEVLSKREQDYFDLISYRL